MKDKIGKIDPLHKLSESDILREIRIVNGIESGLFVPREACKNLIIRNIKKFKRPSLECAEYVHQILEGSISLIDTNQLGSRRGLIYFLNMNTEKILEKSLRNLKKHITDVIESEESYINYDDPDFRLIEPYLFGELHLDDNILK